MNKAIEEIKHFIGVVETSSPEDKANFYYLTRGMIYMAKTLHSASYLELHELDKKLQSIKGWDTILPVITE